MAGKKKRSEPEDSGGGYNWMDTYGDLVTLLLCFFVLLYAFSSVDSAKWAALIQAFTGETGSSVVHAFDVNFVKESAISPVDPIINYENRNTTDDTGPDDDEAREEMFVIGETFDNLYERIVEFIQEHGLENEMSAMRTETTITIRFSEALLFHSGSAQLLARSDEMLGIIVQLIQENVLAISNITVEGHTDNDPINTAQYPTNWELSAARAVNTLRKLLSYGVIEPNMLTAAGCGEYRPVDTNETAEGKMHNRRVDIVIEKKS